MFDIQIDESSNSDRQIIEHTLRGNLDAFNQLVHKYQDAAYNVAYRMFGERAASENIVQEAFISAYQKLHTFRGESFKPWLLRIVTNACYDEIRRQKRRPTVPLEPIDQYGEEVELPFWVEDSGDSPEEITIQKERSFTIQKCLDRLSADFRIVVILVDILGMSYLEASKIAGVPLGTVRSRLTRARERLGSFLNESLDIMPEALSPQNEWISFEFAPAN